MKIFALMILGVNFRFIFFKKFLVYLLLICFSSCDSFIKEEITGSVYGTTYEIQYYVESHEGFNFSKQIDRFLMRLIFPCQLTNPIQLFQELIKMKK